MPPNLAPLMVGHAGDSVSVARCLNIPKFLFTSSAFALTALLVASHVGYHDASGITSILFVVVAVLSIQFCPTGCGFKPFEGIGRFIRFRTRQECINWQLRNKIDPAFVVIGGTGTGKSSLVNRLIPPGSSKADVSNSIDGTTLKVTVYEVVDDAANFQLADTPGIADSRIKPLKLWAILISTLEKGRSLRGVIVTRDPRMNKGYFQKFLVQLLPKSIPQNRIINVLTKVDSVHYSESDKVGKWEAELRNSIVVQTRWLDGSWMSWLFKLTRCGRDGVDELMSHMRRLCKEKAIRWEFTMDQYHNKIKENLRDLRTEADRREILDLLFDGDAVKAKRADLYIEACLAPRQAVGSIAELSDIGFQAVCKERNHEQMKIFIQRLVQHVGGKVLDENRFNDFVMSYVGKAGVKSLQQLVEDLERKAAEPMPFVKFRWPAGQAIGCSGNFRAYTSTGLLASSAELSETGHDGIWALRSPEEMKLFVSRVVQSFNGQVLDQSRLNTFAENHITQPASFAFLVNQLARKAKDRNPFVQFPTQPRVTDQQTAPSRISWSKEAKLTEDALMREVLIPGTRLSPRDGVTPANPEDAPPNRALAAAGAVSAGAVTATSVALASGGVVEAVAVGIVGSATILTAPAWGVVLGGAAIAGGIAGSLYYAFG